MKTIEEISGHSGAGSQTPYLHIDKKAQAKEMQKLAQFELEIPA